MIGLCPQHMDGVEPEAAVESNGGVLLSYRCPTHRWVAWTRWYPVELIEQGA